MLNYFFLIPEHVILIGGIIYACVQWQREKTLCMLTSRRLLYVRLTDTWEEK